MTYIVDIWYVFGAESCTTKFWTAVILDKVYFWALNYSMPFWGSAHNACLKCSYVNEEKEKQREGFEYLYRNNHTLLCSKWL